LTLALAVAGITLMSLYRRQVAEAIEEALNHFRGGGPRPPTHPLPADDGLIVRRKKHYGRMA
jgi:hypothetical protein